MTLLVIHAITNSSPPPPNADILQGSVVADPETGGIIVDPETGAAITSPE